MAMQIWNTYRNRVLANWLQSNGISIVPNISWSDERSEGTKNDDQQIGNGKNPSILTENPDKLLREGVGKGKSYGSRKEVVDFGRTIGEYYDLNSNQYYETTRGTIHYDNNGNAHIVPAIPGWMMKK